MILFDWILGHFGLESVVRVSYFVHLFFYLLIRKTQAYLGIVFMINAKNKSVTIRDAKKSRLREITQMRLFLVII